MGTTQQVSTRNATKLDARTRTTFGFQRMVSRRHQRQACSGVSPFALRSCTRQRQGKPGYGRTHAGASIHLAVAVAAFDFFHGDLVAGRIGGHSICVGWEAVDPIMHLRGARVIVLGSSWDCGGQNGKEEKKELSYLHVEKTGCEVAGAELEVSLVLLVSSSAVVW